MLSFEFPGERYLPDAVQFSPDGRLLAVQGGFGVVVLDTVSGATRPIGGPRTGKRGTPGVGFTADSRAVVHFRYDTHDVCRFDLDTGEDRVLRASQPVPWFTRGDVVIPAVSPDGRLVFVAHNPEERTTEITAHDTATGEAKFSFARQKTYLRELTVSADGKWVAACGVTDLRVWAIGGKLSNRAKWHAEDREQSCAGNLALAADGAYLAVGGYSGSGRVRVWNLKTSAEQAVGEPGLGGGGVAFAPDRPLLAFTTTRAGVGQVVFWDPTAAAEIKRFDWGLGELKAVAFSPDGCRCAAADPGRVVVWDVDG